MRKIDKKKVELAKAHIEAYNLKNPPLLLLPGTMAHAKRFVALYNAYVTMEEAMNIYRKKLRRQMNPKPWPRKRTKKFHQMRVGG